MLFNIESLKLSDLEDEFKPSRLNIIVGPNNSGKSLFLRELSFALRGQRGDLHGLKILKNLVYKFPNNEVFLNSLVVAADNVTFSFYPGLEHTTQGDWTGSGSGSGWPRAQVENCFINARNENESNEVFSAKPELHQLFEFYLAKRSIKLDGRYRFRLTDPQNWANLFDRSHKINHLDALHKEPDIEKKVKQIIWDTFKLHFSFHTHVAGQYNIYLSKEAVNGLDRCSTEEASAFYTNTKITNPISFYGDGIKAFIGIILAVYCSDYDFILIDEPEVFLHPPLARKLGYYLGKYATDSDKQLFVATHSSDFLLGCLDANNEATLIRMEHLELKAVSSQKRIQPEDVKTIIKNPLLKTTRVIDSLFYQTVVITEDDTDRVFYTYINDLLNEHDKSGIQDCLFLNTNGCSGIPKIVKPLKKLGINLVVIPDFDVLGNSNTFPQLLAEMVLDSTKIEVIKTAKSGFVQKLGERGSICSEGAVKLAMPIINADEELSRTKELILDLCCDEGIYFVHDGAMESWNLSNTATKEYFMATELERIATDIENEIMPNFNEGVFKFIKDIAARVN